MKLNWATANERQSDYFVIEKSKDGLNFEAIGKIKGTGESNKTINYSFLDEEISQRTSYYRLKQTDKNGKAKYFDIISVTCDEIVELNIYPNPNEGVFTIEGIQQNSEIIITDLLGQTVFNVINLESRSEINLTHLRSGIYFLRADSQNQISIKKIIIN